VPPHSSRDKDSEKPQAAYVPAAEAVDRYVAISARGIEPVTAAELRNLGAKDLTEVIGGVQFSGNQSVLYRACLELRTASRVVKPLKEFAAVNPEMLYSQVRRIPWEIYLDERKTLAVYATIQGTAGRSKEVGGQSVKTGPAKRNAGRDNPRGGTPPAKTQGINHSQYAALKIKDAIVDRLRQELGSRPNVDTINPDLRIHAFFAGGRCTLSIDAIGASLHERGYRQQTTGAPLKETLAAAIVDLSGWTGQVPLYDPMCGSGTLVIEAARKALRMAPGLNRERFACQRWPDHDPQIWQATFDTAKAQIRTSTAAPIFASDSDPAAIRAAKANAQAAGVAPFIQFELRKIEDSMPPTKEPGWIITNPPYGERLSKDTELERFYGTIGSVWKERFSGWTACFFAGNLGLTRSLGLEASARYKLYNGPLDCRLLKFPLN
jgi:putative N6-adenine-specific DNA methylase